MTLLLERGDIPGFKVGRRRRRHEKRGGAWVRGHRVSGLVQLCFRATFLPRNIGMPENLFCKLLFRSRNCAEHRITRQEMQQPTALRVDAKGLAYRPVAYRLTRMTAIRIGLSAAACGRSREVTNGSFVAAKLREGPRASAAASGKSGCPVWVAMRLTSLRVRRRKVVVEFSLPGSSRSSPSADDPLLP